MDKDDETMTCREAGRRGGKATAERHGHEHFVKIGLSGGRWNAATHDHEHFVEIGRRGGKRLKELLAKGRQAEAEESR